MNTWADIWRQIEDDGKCWKWTGYTTDGYGRMRWHGKMVLVSHLMYERFWGTLPEGLNVLHTCDNPACVNPGHIYAGTHAQNVADRVARNRSTLAVGEHHHSAKLTSEDIPSVRALIEGGSTYGEIARAYGVRATTIRDIAIGKTWKHVSTIIIDTP